MANSIRIKRSSSTNEPSPTLVQGEIANSESGSPNGINEFWIGVTGPANFKLVRNLNGAPAEPTAGLATATIASGDYMIFEDISDSQGKRTLLSNVPLSYFSNDQSWNNYVHPNHTGQVTSTGDGATALTVSAITAQPASGAISAADTILVNDGGVLSEATFTQLNTYFNSSLSFGNGTVTSITAGNGMSFTTITGSGAVTMGTPSTLTAATTNTVTAGTHTHAITTTGTGTIMASSGATLTGQFNCADNDVNRPTLEDYGVKHQAPTVSANAVTVDCTLGNSVLIDLDPATAAVTLTLSNPPPSGTYGEVNIAIVMGTPAYGITWPGSVTWQGGVAPSLTTTNNVVDLVHLFTVDGGTTWYGTYALADATAGGGTVSSVATGTGLSGGPITSTGTIDLDFDNLAEKTGNLVAGDRLVGVSGTTHFAETISAIPLSIFSNDSGWEANDPNTVLTTSVGSATWNWILDQDTMSSNSAAHVPTQQSVKAYVDNAVVSALRYQSGYNASTNTPDLDTSPSASIQKGWVYIVTVAGTFFTTPVQVGDMLIANQASPTLEAHWDIVEANQQPADQTTPGYVTVGAQSFGGTKSFEDISGTDAGATLDSFIIDGGTF